MIPSSAFQIPFRDKLLNLDGTLTQVWQWFFRDVYERLYPLGKEKSFALVNNINAKAFASGDVNTGSDFIILGSHGLYTGLKGRMTTDDTLPTGLAVDTDYYIIRLTSNTFKFATSLANANAGTAIDITGAGTGNHTFTPIAPIDNLKFSPKGVTCVILKYLVQRITTGGSAQELTEFGMLTWVYNPTSETWSKITISEENPDDAGITLTMDANGQVNYYTTAITGTESISRIFYRASTLSGKNVSYSSLGSR